MNQQVSASKAPMDQHGKLRRVLAVMLGLVVLVMVVATAAWWLSPPTLETLPPVPSAKMDIEVRKVISNASTHVALHVRDASAWGDLGAVFFVHGFETQSQVCFRNAERLEPGNYRWSYLLAVSLTYSDPDQMIAAYQRASQRCGKRSHVRLRLTEALLDRGELDDAAVQIEQVLADSPSNSRGQLAKARLLFAQGNTAQARTWAEKSADGSGKRAPYLLLAQLCRRLHDAPGEAKAVAALQLIPDGFTPWDDPDMATILALRRDRSDGSSAAASLAREMIRENKLPEAESLLRRELAGSPSDERLHFLLAAACYQQKKYSEAEVEYDRVIGLKPDNVEAWLNLGLSRLQLGKPDEAGEALAAAVRISPSNVPARVSLAELLLAQGKAKEALEHLNVAVKLAPEEKRAHELLARAKSGK